MPFLIITTAQGRRNEVEVRDIHDANRELNYFARNYLNGHPNDRIVDACVITSGGSLLSRLRGNQLEDF